MVTPRLKDVNSRQAFYVIDGTTAHNLKELICTIEKMNDSTFQFHVNDQRHDISTWVEEVRKDPVLAEKLLHAKTQQEVVRILQKKIAVLEKSFPQPLSPVQGRSSNIEWNVPEPPLGYRAGYQKYQVLVTATAGLLLLAVFGLTSKALSLTGSIVAQGYIPGEIQFLGVGGIGAVLILLFITLQVIKHKHSTIPKNFGGI